MAQNPAPEAPDASGEVFEVVEQKPELLGGLEGLMGRIVYPEMARRAGIEGKVFVQFVVDESGYVTDATAVMCPNQLLCDAAVSAVRESRFTPGRHRGVPVKVRFTIPIDFKLRDADESTPQEASPLGYLSDVLGDVWDGPRTDAVIGAPVFGQVKNGNGTLIYEAPSDPELDRVLATVRSGRLSVLDVRPVLSKEV